MLRKACVPAQFLDRADVNDPVVQVFGEARHVLGKEAEVDVHSVARQGALALRCVLLNEGQHLFLSVCGTS